MLKLTKYKENQMKMNDRKKNYDKKTLVENHYKV